ncbi:MAG: 50S ribosomal protein L35ae [DPANN group archaeon]|nr:50S ribosomal protein L35ae [DPANN group archaeon]MBI4095554.1 50S ribosomal protein L35ae [DPANN group archaeon]
MKAVVLNYRGSHKQQTVKQMLVQVDGVKSKAEAAKLVGKTVTYTTQTGKKISGKISAPHGGKGVVRVIFAEKGLPGQALGAKVDVD